MAWCHRKITLNFTGLQQSCFVDNPDHFLWMALMSLPLIVILLRTNGKHWLVAQAAASESICMHHSLTWSLCQHWLVFAHSIVVCQSIHDLESRSSVKNSVFCMGPVKCANASCCWHQDDAKQQIFFQAWSDHFCEIWHDFTPAKSGKVCFGLNVRCIMTKVKKISHVCQFCVTHSFRIQMHALLAWCTTLSISVSGVLFCQLAAAQWNSMQWQTKSKKLIQCQSVENCLSAQNLAASPFNARIPFHSKRRFNWDSCQGMWCSNHLANRQQMLVSTLRRLKNSLWKKRFFLTNSVVDDK